MREKIWSLLHRFIESFFSKVPSESVQKRTMERALESYVSIFPADEKQITGREKNKGEKKKGSGFNTDPKL